MPNQTQLPAWLHLPPAPDGSVDLGALKAALAACGVNGRGWRLYLDYGDTIFEPLGRRWIGNDRPLRSPHNALIWLRLLQACEMDVLPPPPLVRALGDWGIPSERLERLPPLLLRAAWKACIAADYRGEALADFIPAVITPVARRFFESGDYRNPDTQRLKAGWETLQRHYAPPPPPSATPAALWRPAVRQLEWGAFRLEALDTAAALVDEGEAMHHCIGSYDQRLGREMLVAFSVRKRKERQRVATVTIGEVCPGRWEVRELKGPCNAPVPADVERAAFALIRVYEDAYVEVGKIRAEIDAQRARVLKTAATVADVEFEDCF